MHCTNFPLVALLRFDSALTLYAHHGLWFVQKYILSCDSCGTRGNAILHKLEAMMNYLQQWHQHILVKCKYPLEIAIADFYRLDTSSTSFP